MDPKFKLDRLTTLWETGTKSTRRAAVGGLVFAAVVLVNVLQPYAEAADDREALTRLDEEQTENRQERVELAAHLDRLGEIGAVIREAPWAQHKDSLILRFAQGRVDDAPAAANATLEQIAAEVEENVVAPLEEIIDHDSHDGDLAKVPTTMRAEVASWLDHNRDMPWYVTVASKEQTVGELDANMERVQDEAMRAVVELRSAIDVRDRELSSRSDLLVAELEVQTGQMQQKLDGAIPVWARGLVSVDLMVRTYALVLLGLVIFVLGNGLVAAHHYQGMADARGWSAAERSDPVLSSLWTLTWRGPAGTLFTVACYAAVLMALWACLTLGLQSVGGDGLLTDPPWFAHAVMALAVIAVIAAPMRSRSRGSAGPGMDGPSRRSDRAR